MAYKAEFDEYRNFGVEIETFGVPRYVIRAGLTKQNIWSKEIAQTEEVPELGYWGLKAEGTITGNHPVEIVSPVMAGKDGLTQLNRVLTVLSNVGCRVNYSCGFHVHWSAGDFTGKNMLSLLRLYAKFERVIDFLVHPTRRGNRNEHCQSLLKDGFVDGIGWITDLDPSERRRASQIAIQFEREYALSSEPYRTARGSRHHKVNITAYNKYGTVEFRHHQGTLDVEKAVNWVLFTQQMMNKAKHVSVSRDPSAKQSMGELLRILKLVDHEFIEEQCVDLHMIHLAQWMKKRYKQYKSADRYGGMVDLELAVSMLAA